MSNYTVYCRDTFDGTTWNEKFSTLEEAESYAKSVAGTMLTAHVDGPDHKLVSKFGSY